MQAADFLADEDLLQHLCQLAARWLFAMPEHGKRTAGQAAAVPCKERTQVRCLACAARKMW